MVTPAASAEEALELVEAAWPDVLVSDISMPGHDGYWLVREVTARRPAACTIRALAVTGYGWQHDRAKALAAGFQDQLPKPLDPAEFCEHVEALARSA